jgi:hypothetical protein
LKVTPEGNAPDSDNVDLGEPPAVTVKELGVLSTKIVSFALIIMGAQDPGPRSSSGRTSKPRS